MARPTVGPLTERLYRELAPLAHADAEHDWTLLKLCAALCEPWQWLDDLVRDGVQPGWSALLDPDRCPPPFLAWLAQYAGVVFPPGLPDADRRQYIKDAPGHQRGRPAAIVAAITPYLTGTRRVIYRNRAPGVFRQEIITYAAETPDPAAAWAGLLTQKPGGHVFVHTILAGWTVGEMELAYQNSTIAALEGDFATVGALEMNLPPLRRTIGGLEDDYAGATVGAMEAGAKIFDLEA